MTTKPITIWCEIGVYLVGLWAVGCTSNTVSLSSHPDTQTSNEKSSIELLLRAETLWRARQSRLWDVVYQFHFSEDLIDVETKQMVTLEEFVEWSNANEPFEIESFQIRDVNIQDDIGWVEIDYRTSIKQFPNLPVQDTYRSEVWQLFGDEWYLVPMREVDQFPISPHRRDLDQEEELRARAREIGESRINRDWSRLYLMTDPEDQQYVTFQRFSDVESRIDYKSYEIVWVEAVGNNGRVQMAYRMKLDDPSMTKLPYDYIAMVDQWKKIGDQWFLDIRASTEGE